MQQKGNNETLPTPLSAASALSSFFRAKRRVWPGQISQQQQQQQQLISRYASFCFQPKNNERASLFSASELSNTSLLPSVHSSAPA